MRARRREAGAAAKGGLAALLLAAALAAAGAAPAEAEDGQPDNTARYSACLGEALAPYGFTDMEGSFAEDAVNCLAYYGVARGTSPRLFSPGNSVTRWQMALFLVRAAEAAGADLAPPEDQGFTDIWTLGSATQNAVNQMAALGVTRGTGEDRFTPYGLVTRRQMALFLHRFMGEIPIGEGGAEVGGTAPDDTQFEDIETLSTAAERAVRVLYEMGITAGTSDTRFSPHDRVNRGQMAVFIARALDHSNTRPAGVTVQVDRASVAAGDTIGLHFSVRDEQHRPVEGAPLDIFSASPHRVRAAFDEQGYCSDEAQGVFTGQVCQIDSRDRRTDDLGNVFAAIEITESRVFWAWTGARRDVFRDGSTDAGLTEVTVAQPAARLVVEDDMRRGAARLRLGEPVTFTMQLTDRFGNPAAAAGAGVRVSTRIDVGSARGQPVIKSHSLDSFGRLKLTFRQLDPDPSADSGGDYIQLVMSVTAGSLEVVDRTTARILAGAPAALRWVEEEAAPSLLRLSQAKAYHLVSDAGAGAAHLVIADLLDQYGEPVEGARLDFTSDDRRGVGASAQSMTTDARGAAILRYLRDGTSPGTETITVRAADAEGVKAAEVRHHWAVAHRATGVLGAEIVAFDLNDDVIILYPDFPALIRYDSNDEFRVEGSARTFAQFEAALRSGGYERLSFFDYSPERSAVNSFELSNVAIYDSA